jgi:hypothetical protein
MFFHHLMTCKIWHSFVWFEPVVMYFGYIDPEDALMQLQQMSFSKYPATLAAINDFPIPVGAESNTTFAPELIFS